MRVDGGTPKGRDVLLRRLLLTCSLLVALLPPVAFAENVPKPSGAMSKEQSRRAESTKARAKASQERAKKAKVKSRPAGTAASKKKASNVKKAAAVAQPRAAPRKIPRLHITLRNVNTHDRVNTLRLYEKGRGRALVFNRKGKRKVDWLLRDTRSGRVRPPPDRLVNQLYQAQQHFDAPIHLISGYRGWARKTSRHFKGWAIDFRVEGVPTKTLWNFCKTFAKTGCGYYPTSGFVHMDLRDKAYTWIDVSGPGESAQYVKSDKAARSVPDANAVRADTPTEGAGAPEGDDEGDKDDGEMEVPP